MYHLLSRRGLVLALAVIILSLGCGGASDQAPDIKVESEMAPSPPRKGETTVHLLLKSADGQPVEGATLRIEGNMSHAGMKPVFGDARETAPGRYEAPLTFTMGGDWFLLVTGKLADGRRLERKIDVPGVASR